MIFLFLLLIFLSEIWVFSSDLSYFLSIFFGLLLGFKLFFYKKNFSFSKNLFFYLLFLIFSLISLFFSQDKENSLKSFFIFLTAIFYFLEGLNIDFKKEKIIQFFNFLFLFSISIFIFGLFFKFSFFKDPKSFFYSGYYHHSLGEFLGGGFLINNFFLWWFLFLPFFIFSYSRSSYLALIIIFLFDFFKKKFLSFFKIFFLGFLFLLILLFSKEIRSKLPLNYQKFIFEKLKVEKEKRFFGFRDRYYFYALRGLIEKPFFGVGLGNFSFLVDRYQENWGEYSFFTHNLFLEILSETGIIAFSFFFLFFFSIFAFNFKNNYDNQIFRIFFYFSLIFLTSFLYSYYFVFFLWFFLAGYLTPKEKIFTLKKQKFFRVFLIIIFLFFQFIFINHWLFFQKKYFLILKYPFLFKKEAYEELIKEKINEKNYYKAEKIIDNYLLNYFQNPRSITKSFYYYRLIGDKKKAKKLVYEIFEKKPFDLILLIEDEKNQEIFEDENLKNFFKNNLSRFNKNSDLYKKINEMVNRK